MNAVNASNRARIALAALVLILGAYWAGERFGPRIADFTKEHQAPFYKMSGPLKASRVRRSLRVRRGV